MVVPSTSLVSLLLSAALAGSSPVAAFQRPVSASSSSPHVRREGRLLRSSEERRGIGSAAAAEEEEDAGEVLSRSRRAVVAAAAAASSLAFAGGAVAPPPPARAAAADETKFVQSYDDFTATSEGWSYKEVKLGQDGGGGGAGARDGDRVVFDWSGYTIGYFGRPFEAKGGPQGGAFDKEPDYFRAVLGAGTLVPGCECALRGMRPGGIRQVIVPYGPLSYPPDDPEHDRAGPKPTTFSGMRALNFVLENPRVDRTLLFNLKLVRVDRPDGRGGFARGG